MNANEIVRALRCCSNTDTRRPDCESCPLFGTRMCVKTMLEGGADLIESLQAQLDAYEATGLTPGGIKDLRALCEKDGLAKYVDLIVWAKRQIVKDNERSIEQDERIEQLEKQLAESQRRADAAVEDMTHIANSIAESKERLSGGGEPVNSLHLGRCDVCKKIYHEDKPCKFEWRGQEEGENR